MSPSPPSVWRWGSPWPSSSPPAPPRRAASWATSPAASCCSGPATPTALDVAVDPALDGTPDGRLAVTLAQPTDVGYLDVALLHVATQTILEHYDLDLDDIDRGTEILTVPPSERLPSEGPRILDSDALFLDNTSQLPQRVTDVDQITPGYTSLPGSFITPEAMRRHGWESVPVGWIVETDTPITPEQLTAVRGRAADAGLLAESRVDEPDITALKWGATAAGTLLALGVLAMTVGVIRNAAARDLRTLTATGATSATRRTLTAATAGGLALLGAALGTAGAYIGLTAGYVNDLDSLTPVPLLPLAAVIVGFPCAAAVAGWLLAGREPAVIARQPIE